MINVNLIPRKPIIGSIYGLLDPRSLESSGFLGSIFYIGITTQDLKHRLFEHISDSKKRRSKNLRKEKLIRDIMISGFRPIIFTLQKSKLENLLLIEKFYVLYYKMLLGNKITNITDGGDFNPFIFFSEEKIIEMKKKISVKNKENQLNKKIEKAKELNLSLEDYLLLMKQKKHDNHLKWFEEKNYKQYHIEHTKNKRAFLKEKLGITEYKKLVAKDRREWYSSLTEEQKIIQRKKESEYRKLKRLNESSEEKKKRKETAARWRKEKIVSLSIEERKIYYLKKKGKYKKYLEDMKLRGV